MKRRQVITAIGTLALGAGTALGTGAFDASSANSDSSLSIVTQGGDANIVINAGNENDNDGTVVVNPGSDGPEYLNDSGLVFENLSLDDLPLAVVSDDSTGQGMVKVQIAVAAGQSPNFQEAVEIVNNDNNQDYEVGFTYTQYGSGLNYAEIDEEVANNTFVFKSSSNGTRISPNTADGENPENLIEITRGGNSQLVDIKVNADQSELTDVYGDIDDDPFYGAGDFSDNASTAKHDELIDQVTAVANEIPNN